MDVFPLPVIHMHFFSNVTVLVLHLKGIHRYASFLELFFITDSFYKILFHIRAFLKESKFLGSLKIFTDNGTVGAT